jgi:hypothetical protein
MNELKLTWKDVFNCQKIFPADFNECQEFVKNTRYKFMAFNGNVYRTTTNSLSDIICSEESLT